MLLVLKKVKSYRVATAPRKQEKLFKKNPVRETREFENFAKTQGLLIALVVNSLILDNQDIAIFAKKFSIFQKSDSHINCHKFLKLAQGKYLVGQGK